MAKIKLQGNANGSGVFTLTSPNSNTDRTIVLPDADVTLGTDATKLPLAGGTLTGNVTGVKLGLGVAPTRFIDIKGVQAVGGGGSEIYQRWQVSSDNANVEIGFSDSPRQFNFGTATSNALSLKTNNTERLHINSSGNVGIGTTPETTTSTYTNLQVGGTGTVLGYKTQVSGSDFILGNNVYYNSGFKRMYNEQASMLEQLSGTINLKVSAAGSADSAITWTNALHITNDGRGVSDFTIHAWCHANQTGTQAINDSHNISSITDNAVGATTFNLTTNSASSPAWLCSGAKSGGGFSDSNSWIPSVGETGGASSFRVDAYNMSASGTDTPSIQVICVGKA